MSELCINSNNPKSETKITKIAIILSRLFCSIFTVEPYQYSSTLKCVQSMAKIEKKKNTWKWLSKMN